MRWYGAGTFTGRERAFVADVDRALGMAREGVTLEPMEGYVLVGVQRLNPTVVRAILESRHGTGFMGGPRPALIPEENVAALLRSRGAPASAIATEAKPRWRFTFFARSGPPSAPDPRDDLDPEVLAALRTPSKAARRSRVLMLGALALIATALALRACGR